MKTIGIILLVLLVILALLVGGLQVFLTQGLTSALNQGVFPAVKSMYGLDMSIGNASVNLFQGNATLEEFRVRNLKGYEQPWLLELNECVLDIDLFSLIGRNPVIINQVTAEGAVLTVERNNQEKFNVKELADALRPVESAESAPAEKTPAPQEPVPEEEPAAKAAPAIPVRILRIAVDTTLRLIDSEDDREYTLNLKLTGSDIFTLPAAEQPDSLLVLRGSLAHDTDAFTTDLNAIIQPLTDLQNPSFNATGSILDIDAEFLSDLLTSNDMEADSFSIKPAITCKTGQLSGSKIDLTLNRLVIYDTEIGDTTLTLPLGGTLQKPVLDITGALKSLFSQQAVNIGKAVGLKKLKEELGVEGDTTGSIAISALTNNVDEIAGSPALQQLIKQVLPGQNTDTNSTPTNKPVKKAVGAALSEQLEKNVKELEGNEAVRGLIKGFFGN